METVSESSTVSPVHVEAVTSAHQRDFRQNGWTLIRGLLNRDVALAMRDHIESELSAGVNTALLSQPFRYHHLPSSQSPFLKGIVVSPQMAAVARRLSGHSSVRFWVDACLAKEAEVAADESSTPSAETPWHQDLPVQPFDRRGSLNIWIALDDCTAEMGTLRFLSGSQKEGPLGRVFKWPKGVRLTDVYPDLEERYSVSAPFDMNAGDATVHDSLVVHSAPNNRGARTRWAYTVGWMPGHTLYTGAAALHTDGIGLEVDKEFDHPNFPLFAES